MPLWRDDAVAPLAYRQGHQLSVLIERFGSNADIRLAGHHPFGDLRRAALVHFKLDRGVLRDKITHHEQARRSGPEYGLPQE